MLIGMTAKSPIRLGHGVFLGKGKGWKSVQEDLPTDKSQRELCICKKFVGALRRVERKLSCPVSISGGPHDCMCSENDMDIVIQMTEATIPRVAAVQSLRQQYATRIQAEVAPLATDLVGLLFQLQLGGGFTVMPGPNTPIGRRVIGSFRKAITPVFNDLDQLEVKYFLPRRWTVDGLQCGFVAIRFASRLSGIGPIIRHDGSITTDPGEMEESLPNSIQRKLAKRYAKPTEGKLFLLAYDLHGSIACERQEPDPYRRSRELLRQWNHPFDEVWYFVPLAGDANGCAPIHIWPRV